MPMYDYRCPACGSRFEQFVRMSEADAPVTCPECGTPKATKLISSFAVIGGSSGGGSFSSSSASSCSTGGG